MYSSPLFERVVRTMPRLLVLTAPAGYGKTTMALQYASIFKSHAAIDLARTPNPRALLLALLKTLSSEKGGDAYLRQAQLSLAADEAVPPQLAERVLDAWREPGAPVAVVFDNAEMLSPEMLPLFNEVLERRPTHRACVVCSAIPLGLQTSAIASPAETMLIATDDLALSEDETRRLFADSATSAEQLRRVLDVAQGWPLATLLLRRIHAQGRLSIALTFAEQSTDRHRFYEFIQDQAVESLPAAQRRVLEFCASVPDVGLQDIRTCLGVQAEQALRAAVGSLPLIRIEGDHVRVHPLLRSVLASANQHAAEDLKLAARAALRRGERGTAAERYIACGDRIEAGKVLDDMLERGATAEIAALAASLDHAILERHPMWFAVTAFLRRYDVPPAQHLAGIQAHRASAEQTVDEVARFAIGAVEAHQLLHCGLHEQMQERLQSLDTLVAALKRGGIVNALRAHVAARFADTLRAALAVALGETELGERLLKRARFTLGQFPMITLSGAVDGWVGIGILRADIQLIRQQCSRARESLERTGLDIVLLDLDANEAFAGWLLGDDVMYKESIERVDARARTYRMRAFEHLLACAGLRAPSDAIGLEPLRRLIIAHLLGAGRSKDRQGLQHAQRALHFARQLRQPLFVTLAAIAVRERDGDPKCEPDETLALAPALQQSFLERMRG